MIWLLLCQFKKDALGGVPSFAFGGHRGSEDSVCSKTESVYIYIYIACPSLWFASSLKGGAGFSMSSVPKSPYRERVGV